MEKRLKEAYKDSLFSEKDISSSLKIPFEKAHYIRYKLLKNGEIVRLAQGIYKFRKNKIEFNIFPHLEILRQILLKLNKKFVFTATSLLNNFFNKNICVLYVEKGAAKLFETEIERFNLNYTVLVNPTKDEINLFIEKANAKNFIIIRENSYFYSSKKGIASVDSAFVDLYFEITRGKLPLENKLASIFEELAGNDCINISTLLKCAKERGIKKEIIDFIRLCRVDNEIIKERSENAE